MENTFWHKQTTGKPLFPELLWSRPENKNQAGKLLIIGGHAQSFAAPAEAYGDAIKAGIGTARVILPDALSKTVSQIFPEAEFAPSNPSGGFAKNAVTEILAEAAWADGALLAGEFGRNSETAIVLESLLQKFNGQVTITKDALDYFTASPASLLNRQQTTAVLSFAQLQKIAGAAKFTKAFTFEMDILRLIEALHNFTLEFPVDIITKQFDTIFIASGGQVSSTKLRAGEEIWRLKVAAHASVWWLQNPTKTFEALTTAVFELAEKN